MGLTNENVGPKILAKIKIYVLTRVELLFKVCYEIPCSTGKSKYLFLFSSYWLTKNPFSSWLKVFKTNFLHMVTLWKLKYLRIKGC